MSDFAKHGDVEVQSINLKNVDGTKIQSIKSQVAVIDIYEDITKPYLYCTLSIGDSVGLLEAFPILGEETVELVFRSRTRNEFVTYNFAVTSVQDGVTTKANNMRMFVLACTSIDQITNMRRRIQKSFKTSHGDMVLDILRRSIGTQKNILVEQTRGIQQYIAPNLTPFQAVDQIRIRASSSKYNYSPFVFFETKDEYYFTSIANLYETGMQNPVREYTHGMFITPTSSGDSVNAKLPIGMRDDLEKKTLISYTKPKQQSTLGKLAKGSYASETSRYDLITKKYETVKYKVSGTALSLGEGSINTKSAVNKFSDEPSLRHFIINDSTRPETFEVDTAGPKRAYMELLTQSAMAIEVYGSEDVTAGDVVELKIFNPDDNNTQSKTESGKYLVLNLHHKIILDVQPVFRTSMLVVKGSNITS